MYSPVFSVLCFFVQEEDLALLPCRYGPKLITSISFNADNNRSGIDSPIPPCPRLVSLSSSSPHSSFPYPHPLSNPNRSLSPQQPYHNPQTSPTPALYSPTLPASANAGSGAPAPTTTTACTPSSNYPTSTATAPSTTARPMTLSGCPLPRRTGPAGSGSSCCMRGRAGRLRVGRFLCTGR